MTPEQYERAAILLSELNTLIDARNGIKDSIRMRENQLEYNSSNGRLHNWLSKCAGRIIFKGNKVNLFVRAEGAKEVEFEVDEGFIGTALIYLDARIEEKSKELREL